jgi:hypothetical protein
MVPTVSSACHKDIHTVPILSPQCPIGSHESMTLTRECARCHLFRKEEDFLSTNGECYHCIFQRKTGGKGLEKTIYKKRTYQKRDDSADRRCKMCNAKLVWPRITVCSKECTRLYQVQYRATHRKKIPSAHQTTFRSSMQYASKSCCGTYRKSWAISPATHDPYEGG